MRIRFAQHVNALWVFRVARLELSGFAVVCVIRLIAKEYVTLCLDCKLGHYLKLCKNRSSFIILKI